MKHPTSMTAACYGIALLRLSLGTLWIAHAPHVPSTTR